MKSDLEKRYLKFKEEVPMPPPAWSDILLAPEREPYQKPIRGYSTRRKLERERNQ